MSETLEARVAKLETQVNPPPPPPPRLATSVFPYGNSPGLPPQHLEELPRGWEYGPPVWAGGPRLAREKRTEQERAADQIALSELGRYGAGDAPRSGWAWYRRTDGATYSAQYGWSCDDRLAQLWPSEAAALDAKCTLPGSIDGCEPMQVTVAPTGLAAAVYGLKNEAPGPGTMTRNPQHDFAAVERAADRRLTTTDAGALPGSAGGISAAEQRGEMPGAMAHAVPVRPVPRALAKLEKLAKETIEKQGGE